MSTLYGASATYINNVKTLTNEQFADKVDLMYLNLASNDKIFSVNAVMEGNEVTIHVVFEVPDGADPQDYTPAVIDPILSDAMMAASMNVKENVASLIHA